MDAANPRDPEPSHLDTQVSPTAHDNVVFSAITPMDPPNHTERSTVAFQPARSERSFPSTSSTSDNDEIPILTPAGSTPLGSPRLERSHPALANLFEEEVEELGIGSTEANETESINRLNSIDKNCMTSNQDIASENNESQSIGHATSQGAIPSYSGSENERDISRGYPARLSGAGGIWIQDIQSTEISQAVQERRFVNDGVETRIFDDDGIRIVARGDDEIPNDAPSSMSARGVRDTDTEGSSITNDQDPQRIGMSTQSSNPSGVLFQNMSPGSSSQDFSSGSPSGRSGFVSQNVTEGFHVQSNDNLNIRSDGNSITISSSESPNTRASTSFQSPNMAHTSPNSSIFNAPMTSRSFRSGANGSMSINWTQNHNSNSPQNGGIFRDQTITGHILNGATVSDCCVSSCSGQNLRITDCIFSSCNFSNATIEDCSFSSSNLQDCVVRDCTFSGSNVNGGSRRDCVWNTSNVN